MHSHAAANVRSVTNTQSTGKSDSKAPGVDATVDISFRDNPDFARNLGCSPVKIKVRINLRPPSTGIINRYDENEDDMIKARNETNNPSEVMSAKAAESGQEQHSLLYKLCEAEPAPYGGMDVADGHLVEGILKDEARTPRANAENPNIVRWCLEGECKGEDWCREHLPDTSGLLRLPCQMVTSVSRPLLDAGPRILQQDCGVVEVINSSTPLIVIADGHGSVNLAQVDPGSMAGDVRNTMVVGGRQAAAIACGAVVEFFHLHAAEFRLHAAADFFLAAFVHAHDTILHHIRAGATRLHDPDGPSPPAPSPPRPPPTTPRGHAAPPGGLPGACAGVGSLIEGAGPGSLIDGRFLSDPRAACAQLRAAPGAGGAVVGKVLATLDANAGRDMAFYRRAGGAWEAAEFGTTCTAVAVVAVPPAAPGGPGRKVAVAANAGDSDACLVRAADGACVWLTAEHNLYSEDERDRPALIGGRLRDSETVTGGGSVPHRKLRVSVGLPDGRAAGVAYEPTRGLGHMRGQYCGVVPSPSVSMAEVREGDVIVVGSDGFWNALGGRRAKGDLRPPTEEAEGQVKALLGGVVRKAKAGHAQAIATELMALVKARGLQDNTCLAVAKIHRDAAHATTLSTGGSPGPQAACLPATAHGNGLQPQRPGPTSPAPHAAPLGGAHGAGASRGRVRGEV